MIEIDLVFLLAYLLTGLVAGVLAGLLGIGGGIVVVPVLYFLFGMQGYPDELVIKLAAATSLATIIGTGLSSALSHFRLQNIRFTWLAWLAPGMVIGSIIGATLVDWLPATVLVLIFAVGELLVAAKMGLGLTPEAQQDSRSEIQNAHWLVLFGVGIGALSAMVGIGGGLLTVPLLLWRGAHIRAAIGTSAACGLIIAIPGVTSEIILGWNIPDLPANTLGYVVWPVALSIIAGSVMTAPLGAKLAQKLPVPTLKKVFAIVLLIAGVRMLMPVFWG